MDTLERQALNRLLHHLDSSIIQTEANLSVDIPFLMHRAGTPSIALARVLETLRLVVKR